MKARTDYEARFHAALQRIAAYMTPDRLRRHSEKEYGLSFEESIEMAYDNIQDEARQALAGYRKPRRKPEAVADIAAPSPERAR